MRVNWAAVLQAVIVALLLGVGTTAWRTYEAVTRMPTVEAEISRLSKKLDDLSARAEATNIRQTDEAKDVAVTLAVLESRISGVAPRKRYMPAVLEDR